MVQLQGEDVGGVMGEGWWIPWLLPIWDGVGGSG